MIWIIGGTSETGEFLKKIGNKFPYVVSVATEKGREVLGHNVPLVVARMTPAQMEAFVAERGIQQVVDLTHPFATEVSQNARTVCDILGIRYWRYLRERVTDPRGIWFDSYDQCIEYLRGVEGTVFFTTGSKNIADFEAVRGRNRFIYRILPASFSLQEAVANGVEMKDIVAILGPISIDLNVAMFKNYGADYVVMKDSGKKGGTQEKIEACQLLKIPALIIGRREEEGISDLDTILHHLQ